MGIAVLIMLSPLGLILPGYFKAGSAWGEWGADEVQKLAGYLPSGLAELSSLWNAPFPDYAFKGCREKALWHSGVAYILSAVLGITVIVILALFAGKMLARKGD